MKNNPYQTPIMAELVSRRKPRSPWFACAVMLFLLTAAPFIWFQVNPLTALPILFGAAVSAFVFLWRLVAWLIVTTFR